MLEIILDSHIGKNARIGQDRIGKKKGENDRIDRCKFPVWEFFTTLCRSDRIGIFTRIGFPYGQFSLLVWGR
jgi:hypothetical protein